MRIARSSLVMLSLALMGAVPVSAQEPKLGVVAGKDDVPAMFTKIADCMVDSHPGVIRKWLGYLPGSVAEDNYVMTQEGALTVCMESGRVSTKAKLTYDTNELRPFIAAAAARAAAAKAASSLFVNPNSSPWFSQQLTTIQPDTRINRNALVQQEFGHCVVVANWNASRNLILSKLGSTTEGAAVAALAPQLGSCLQAGTTVELSKSSLRRAISEPFYHLVTDAKQEAAK